MKNGRVVLELMKGLTEVFEGIWRTTDSFGTNGRLGRHVWMDWMGGRAVLGPIKGLADVFDGIRWEAKLFWDL